MNLNYSTFSPTGHAWNRVLFQITLIRLLYCLWGCPSKLCQVFDSQYVKGYSSILITVFLYPEVTEGVEL